MKQKYLISIFFTLLSIFNQILFAQNHNFGEPQIITEENINLFFGKKITRFVDKTNKLSFEQVKKQKFDSIYTNINQDKFIVPIDTTYWFYWAIKSDLKYDTEKFLNLGYISDFEVLAEYENEKTIIRRNGVDIPVSMRDMAITNTSVKLFLPKNKTIKLWIKVKNKDYSRRIIFKLANIEENILKRANATFQDALLQGALWMLFLYNLIFYIINRDKAYLYYLVYIFVSNSLILFTTLPEKFYVGEFLAYTPHIFFTLLGNIAIWYMMFVRHFTQSRKYYPDIDKWVLKYLYFRIIWIMLIILFFVIEWTNYTITTWIVNITIIFDIILGIYIAIRKPSPDNKKINLYLSVGSFCLFIGGGLSTILPAFGLNPTLLLGSWDFSYFEIGLFLQLFIFSIGLGIRGKQIEKEKQIALEKNEKLVKEQNIVLEQKVIERTQQIETQKNIIEQKNEDIISSINYAKRIQTALLPKKEQIETFLPNLLLFYQPKDIVSGDFYWFAHIENESFLVVADCTGHGVPGAFMTVIGENLLDQIINADKIYSPALILKELDIRLLKTLQQQGIETEKVNDGMDISLLKINLSNQKLTFASAKRTLWIFENQKNEITEYKGDKFPIGSSQFKEKIFTEKEINLQKNDLIYAFTDGYADQFGTNGKMTIRRFREILAENKEKSFAVQENILAQKLEEWKQDEAQTDDILVVGIRI